VRTKKTQQPKHIKRAKVPLVGHFLMTSRKNAKKKNTLLGGLNRAWKRRKAACKEIQKAPNEKRLEGGKQYNRKKGQVLTKKMATKKRDSGVSRIHSLAQGKTKT